ncbi:MAG: hypothetical protein A2186_02140 [Candidatus Levybacteria bacterium RIFOXYA1_FULL_41_10]|nr:MAG: hypothetical protein UT44_C0010G0020 [Candidatus Levybacteria bacterium GW2011_GWA1_39_32]KKR50612.1 MAG: hypothetical protein UT87_C0015G0019 [Candidatus Levybacteria bacterium GW2011_GWC1_40_19]KKR73491.1 MAG: hypothetical protein UU15_C0009G0013 [Candidatus Levybacteria bacterium GW2011_GWC2_40_7]KKR94693.1 MAG: hypothetical protein UU45_C0008G0093 [Candidatus Levybacteria bacterium GW2011_GWA2_41_15]KKS01738.1 MAG: hypothetical protein UU52_C0008G0019 [Candidatus Levybacteria bacter
MFKEFIQTFLKGRRVESVARRVGLSGITKRQRFAIGVIFLSLSLFITEHFLGGSGIVGVFVLSALADIFLFWAIYKDLRENFAPHNFILPFFYTLAFGLFYLLVPARLITRFFMTSIYALGLYSIFLSQNIFTVSAIRTIALLSGARTVSFVITLVVYFFLTNVIFSFHLNIAITLLLLFSTSLPLILHSIWTYTLDKSLTHSISWGLLLSLCILELTILLWFWPSTPTVIALFLTGFFYIIVGLSHIWLEKRLFKSVVLEYSWVAIVVFTVLVLFTSWT